MVTADPTRRSPHTTARLAAEAEAVPSRRRGRGSPQYRSSAGDNLAARLGSAGLAQHHAQHGPRRGARRDDRGRHEEAGVAVRRRLRQGLPTMMKKHHQGAVQMAQEEQTNGRNPDAVALAKQIESAQTADVALIDRLLTTT